MMNATEIATAVSAGHLRAADVVADCLDRIARLNPVLNAFTAVTTERARARAAAVDASAMKGPLAGVPFAVKELDRV